MILANWPRRASEEPHSSTAPNRLVEAYFLSWSVSMSSDAPYWRPPSRALSMVFQTYGLEVRFWIASGLPTRQQLSLAARKIDLIPDISERVLQPSVRCGFFDQSCNL